MYSSFEVFTRMQNFSTLKIVQALYKLDGKNVVFNICMGGKGTTRKNYSSVSYKAEKRIEAKFPVILNAQRGQSIANVFLILNMQN